MNVSELIQQLQGLPGDAVIVLHDGYDLRRVSQLTFVETGELCISSPEIITSNIDGAAILSAEPFDPARRIGVVGRDL